MLSLANDELYVDLVARVAPSDLVQETCLQAARDFPNFEGSTEAELRAWLRRILLNNLGDLRRRFLGTQKRGSAQEIQLNGANNDSRLLAEVACQRPLPSDQAISAERCRALHRAVESLPEKYQRVVTLRNFRFLSFQQIGDELQCSVEAARKLWSRAIEKLSQELDDDDASARISS
jgi:RNA polymerase sigma-70 factor (ECF subfamily)